MPDISVEPILARLAAVGEDWPKISEQTMPWRKSTFSGGVGECVEVREYGALVEVRDSKDPDGPTLTISAPSWWSFLAAVKTEQLGSYGGLLQLRRIAPGSWSMWLTSDTETELAFNEGEVRAFVNGVHAHEFGASALAAGDGSDVDASGRPPGSTLADFGAGSVPA